uniref:Uncharacterized protein n=1 Tax=Tanacetum cinerariifolium TaxID=118510 RepID=A0A6L2J373_TANCI|nr:hypothetical protein [Tanacetum cinerariifolium]
MSTPKFAKTYNLVAFLKKHTESEGFEQIIDFLNVSYVKYALTVNPTFYTSCIEQLWATATVKNVKEEAQIQALVDKKKVIVTKASIRRDLRFKDKGGKRDATAEKIALLMKTRVIEFGDSYEATKDDVATGSASEGTATKKGRIVAVTTEDMQKRRNDVKARTTLLLALPDEHKLRFSKYKTAQELWVAILKTFGGNKATKKTKKNLLKQQYGNFKAEEIEQDDINQKFLTSLAPEWLMHTIMWRNRSDLDTTSLDDLYNHLKVYEPEVQKKSKSNSQNMAFISSAKNSSGNEEVNTASIPTASTQVSPTGPNLATANISLDTACAYIASQSNGSQIKYEDINQIDKDDIEEMDIKWNMALLSMRADRFWKKKGKTISIQGTDAPKALMAIDGVEWDWSFMENEEENHALVADEKAPTEFALMAKSSSDNEVEFKTNRIECLTNELEIIKKEKEGLDCKLTGFQSTSEHLDNLLKSQRSKKNKEGLGYSAVPPPPTQVYFPPKKGMSWTGLPEFTDDTITDYSRPSPAIESNSDDFQNRKPSVAETGESSSTILSKPLIKFVKSSDRPTETKTDKVEIAKKPAIKYAKLYRKTSKSTNGNSQNNIDDKGYWDSGCSRHMTGNISYLSDYEPFDGGYVSFGQGGCKITGKETIKTGKLEFENVYFVKDLKYNLFSVSQICDNKNSVLFTDSKCIVLGQNFKLKDDTNVLLRTPRQHNMYSIDLNNVVPHKDLTCLVAKASADQSILWHRRLGKTIKREFSNARTPQQNEVAEKRNNTLIEAARTMLADAKLPVTFRAEAVNTACYVQNRVLVNKSQNKTPYELFNGRTPAIGFLKPFGCHVMILNTLEHLGKFDAKGDEGYFIGYSMSSKAFRVFNKRTKRVEEHLHVNFLKNKAIEKGVSPNWLFDIDFLTMSMNYVPVVVAAHLESSTSNAQDTCNADAPESSGNFNPTATLTNPLTSQLETLTVETLIPTNDTPSLDNILTLTNRFEDILGVTTNFDESNRVEADLGNMENNISASPTPTFKIHKDHPKSQIIGLVDTLVQTRTKSKEMKEQSFIATIHQKTDPALLQFCLFSLIKNKARLVAQGHTQEERIDYDEVFAPVARIEAIRLFLAYASFMGFTVYQMDVKSAFLYGTIDKEVYVMQPLGFQDPDFPARVYKVEKAMGTIDQTLFIRRKRRDFILVQVYVDNIIFESSNPQLCREFEALMHEKFQTSVMGELNFFLGLQVLQKKDGIFLSQDKYVGDVLKKFGYLDVRSANSPMDKENLWEKDGTGKDVDLHLYKSMIRSLMYLTASRPDIMFAVCACARHQYPKDSPFDLVAYSDSDYSGATQDRKSTTGGCQFLGRRLISWQCKKQTIVATSTTEAEYVAAASGYGQNTNFHPIVDFVEASYLRYALTINPTVYVSHIRQFWSTAWIETTDEGTKILATIDVTMGEVSGTPTEPHHTPSPEAQQTSPTTHSSPSLPPVTTEPLPNVIPSNTPQLRQYTRRARIAQSSALPPVADEHASSIGDDSQGEACPTNFGLKAEQDKANIIRPLHCPVIQHQGQQTEMASKLAAQDLEISQLKARVKLLEDRDGGGIAQSREDVSIKGRSLDEGEEAAVERSTKRGSDESEEIVTVLTSLDSAIPTGSGSIPTVSPPGTRVPTGSGVVPTPSPIFTTATVATPYTKRKEMERYAQRMNEQITRDAEIVRIHVEEELQIMIDGLDRNNETVAKYLQEYYQFAAEFPIEERIELISNLVKSQDNYAKVLKYQIQQIKPLSKKQQKEFYMSVLRSHAGWKTRHFKEMPLEEIKEKFDLVWKEIENFIPIGFKEESKRFKRKGLRLEHDSAKKVKTSEEVSEEDLKDMMQLVPVEEVYVEALQVKHPIIDWEIQTEGERSYWKIIRLGKKWRLYDSCGVHHVMSKDQEILMLVEKDYPLRKGLAVVMISNKLHMENYSQMANDLILKIHQIANSPRQRAPEDMGEGSKIPTNTHHIPIVTQPSSFQPLKKQKSRRKQRKEIEVPSPSSEIPNEEGVLDLEEAKTAQAKEIASLKKRVKKLEQKRKSRTLGLKRLRKVGTASRIESSTKASLGDQDDASKQERMIDNIIQDVEVTLVDNTQGKMNEEDMFGVNDLDGDEVDVDVSASKKVEQSVKVVEKEVSTADLVTTAGEVVTTTGIEVTTAATTLKISKDELTLDYTLIEIKAAKPKAITTAATTVTAVGTRPKEKRDCHWIEEFVPMDTELVKDSKKSTEGSDKAVKGSEKAKEGKMLNANKDLQGEEVVVEQEVVADKEPIVDAAQVSAAATTVTINDITLAKALEALKTSKPKIRGVVICVHKKRCKRLKWFSLKAKVDVDYQLAERMQAVEQQELNEEEKAKLFMKLLEKRRKFFAAKRTKKKRNRPPTNAQRRSLMCTYLKNMDGWKPKALKNKSFAEIQELFDKEMKKINTFVDFRIELVEESSKKGKIEITQEESSKRAGDELEQETAKKQKIVDDKETANLKQLVKIIPEEDIAIDDIPLAVKTLIVDWKI